MHLLRGGIIMKKLSRTLAIIISVLALTGCSIRSSRGNKSKSSSDSGDSSSPSSLSTDKPWTKGETIQGDPLEIEISDATIKEYSEKMDRGIELANEGKDFNAFTKIYNDMQSYYYLCWQALRTNGLKHDVYGTDEDERQSLAYSAIATDVEQWFNKVEHICAKNAFKTSFFEGMSDAEIQEYIGQELPQEYYDAQNKTNELISAYYDLDDDEDLYNNIDILYDQLHEAEKTIATYQGYDNYLEYCYENVYGRDYSVADTDSFFLNVYKYAVPAYQSLSSELNGLMNKLTVKEKRIANSILYGDSFTECFNYIEDYKDFFGGFLKQEFDGLFTENGHYNISYEEEGTPGAYEDEFPYGDSSYNYVFFGPGYHSATTVVHEFGHYLAAQANPLSLGSYDLAETQSQSNEYLFLQYLSRFGNYDFSDNFKQFLIDYFVYENIFYLVIPALVNEVEKIVYASSDYKIGDLEDAVDFLYQVYPELSSIYSPDSTYYYCAHVTMYSPGYYISYATSLMGAFNINKIASDNYNAAKEAYMKLIYLDGNFGYLDAYQYAGLGNPFDEETFDYIFGNRYGF